MPKVRKCVVTIHGVNTDGAWQSSVEKVLKPHFDCVAIKYPDYRDLWLTLAAGLSHWAIYVLLVALLGIAACALVGAMSWTTGALAALAAAVMTIIAGVGTARIRRRAVIERIRAEIENAIDPDLHHPNPHMIAHSMGTYLSMSALAGFPTVHLDRIVLVGSVLPRRFKWQDLKRSRGNAFREVRNEMGEGDLVVWLVGRIGSLLPEFGDAGRRGFRGQGAWLHALTGPLGPCGECNGSAAKGWVHNAPLGKAYGHSTHFLQESHCEDLWLPYLWGFDPAEVVRFRDMCLDVLLFKDNGDWISSRQTEIELRRSEWTWTRSGGIPKTLEDFLVEVITMRLEERGMQVGAQELARRAQKAIRTICRMVKRARIERNKYPAWKAAVASWYDPRTAVAAAAEFFARRP